MNNEIVKVVNEAGLVPLQAELVQQGFNKYFDEIKQWELLATKLVVTSIDQAEEMKQAREARLALKNIRCEAENNRKDLKEESVRFGKAVDGVANILKALIVPLEDYFEEQEKFVDKIIAKEKQKKLDERFAQLSPYVQDISIYNLADISEQGFQEILTNAKIIFDAKIEAQRKAEIEIAKQAEQRKVEEERIKLENEQLKSQALAREAEIKAEAEKLEKQRAKEQAENEAKLAEVKRMADEEKRKLEAIALAEATAKKKLEDDIKRKAEEEQAKADAIAKAQKEAELAPDREKLIAYADAINLVKLPELNTPEAQERLSKAMRIITQAVLILKNP